LFYFNESHNDQPFNNQLYRRDKTDPNKRPENTLFSKQMAISPLQLIVLFSGSSPTFALNLLYSCLTGNFKKIGEKSC